MEWQNFPFGAGYGDRHLVHQGVLVARVGVDQHEDLVVILGCYRPAKRQRRHGVPSTADGERLANQWAAAHLARIEFELQALPRQETRYLGR